jgi:hypothetical protein
MIPHRLGMTEAAARLRSGLAEARPALVRVLTVEQEEWTDDQISSTECVRDAGWTRAG